MVVDLVEEILSLKILKRKIVELKDIKVSLNIPGVLVLLKFPRCYLTPQVTNDLVNETGNIQSEQVDDFVYNGRACVIVNAQEFKNLYQLVRCKVIVVELCFQFIDYFEEVPLEMVVIGKGFFSL